MADKLINMKKIQPRIPGVAGRVYKQLLPDYPPQSIEWVKKVHWEGPVHVPLDEIDFSHQNTWRAHHEPDKVIKHAELIEDKNTIPVILCAMPQHDKLECLDGHHRLLAYKALNKPVLAYVAYVPNDDPDSPWLTLHSKQYRGDSRLKLDGTGGKATASGEAMNEKPAESY